MYRLPTFLILALFSQQAFSDPYSSCVADKMRGVQSDRAAAHVAAACRSLTTPRKCRDSAIDELVSAELKNWRAEKLIERRPRLQELERKRSRGEQLTKSEMIEYQFAKHPRLSRGVMEDHVRAQCIEECKNRDLYNRKFGECRTDYGNWW